jgi:hypothetical protein
MFLSVSVVTSAKRSRDGGDRISVWPSETLGWDKITSALRNDFLTG